MKIDKGDKIQQSKPGYQTSEASEAWIALKLGDISFHGSIILMKAFWSFVTKLKSH